MPLAEAAGACFGGKATMLAAMAADGLRIVPGVAISADAYERSLEQAGGVEVRGAFWDEAARDVVASDRLGELSARISSLLREADISGIAIAALERLNGLVRDGGELIVRSSATGEDSTSLSYAGQFSSVRCLAGQSSLETAIERVWDSCTAPSVAAYRGAALRQGRESASPGWPKMGLVVQPYRRFSMSGLMFTQHPVVPVEGWMLLEYLDEEPTRLVSGEVVPQSCRVNATSGSLVWERRIPGRNELEPERLAELVAGAPKLKLLAGADVDVEWGVAEGQVFFLQSRPATTGPQAP
jgi:phosphoenolpyruvate synthase/pyruvate phosphate dikinase